MLSFIPPSTVSCLLILNGISYFAIAKFPGKRHLESTTLKLNNIRHASEINFTPSPLECDQEMTVKKQHATLYKHFLETYIRVGRTLWGCVIFKEEINVLSLVCMRILWFKVKTYTFN
jgi:hypothetical protein